MDIRTKKPRNRILLGLIGLIIILTIITFCVQAVAKNSLINTSIISGRDVAKNEATVELEEINWTEAINAPFGETSYQDEYVISFSNPVTILDNGKAVKMIGNYNYPGNNSIYYIPESQQQQQIFSFNYEIDFGDSFNSAGFLLRVKEVDNTLQGYMISFNNDGWYPTEYTCRPEYSWFTECGSKTGTIWKFSLPIYDNLSLSERYKISETLWRGGDYSYNIQKTLVQVFDLPYYRKVNTTNGDPAYSSGTIQITSTPNQIIISCEGTSNEDSFNTTIDISPDDEVGDGFGFFSTHYSHACTNYGQFNINNFSVKFENSEPHNLYIDPNGGTWNGSSAVSTVEGEYGDEVEIPLPTRPGYNFAGWMQTGNSGNMSSLTEEAIYTFGEDADTDDTITAQWTKVDVSKVCRIDTGEDNGDTTEPGDVTYVVEGQQIVYTMTATNTGTVDATVLIKDSAPEGTIFVENSIKVNDEDTSYTETDLENGISIPVAKDSKSTLSFKVEINELTNGEIISNKALYKDITISQETEEKESNEVQSI